MQIQEVIGELKHKSMLLHAISIEIRESKDKSKFEMIKICNSLQRKANICAVEIWNMAEQLKQFTLFQKNYDKLLAKSEREHKEILILKAKEKNRQRAKANYKKKIQKEIDNYVD